MSRRERDERGGASMFVAITVPALFAAAGLVVDGNARLQAAARADAVAAEAARAGSQSVSPEVLTGGPTAVDPYRAAAVARAWLAEQDVTGTVQIVDGGTALDVETTISEPTTMAEWIGIEEWTVTGHATAVLARDKGDVP
jgi:hypothetical protein